MTTKECLKRIDENNYLTEREHKEFLNVIEKDLDLLEELRDLYDIVTKGNWNLKEENLKLKKAIEIIKTNYPIELKFTKHSDRNDNYNKYYLIVNHTLAVVEKEEYELLKKVLC